MAKEDLERWFPSLKNEKCWEKTSEETESYNCFAWAAGFTDRRFDPTDWPDCYWPKDITKSYEIDSFVELFRSLGFESSETHALELGYTKIALYEDQQTGEAMHAARQLTNGKWSSKIGDYEDISHDALELLEGYYGTLSKIMKRRIPDV